MGEEKDGLQRAITERGLNRHVEIDFPLQYDNETIRNLARHPVISAIATQETGELDVLVGPEAARVQWRPVAIQAEGDPLSDTVGIQVSHPGLVNVGMVAAVSYRPAVSTEDEFLELFVRVITAHVGQEACPVSLFGSVRGCYQDRKPPLDLGRPRSDLRLADLAEPSVRMAFWRHCFRATGRLAAR